MATLENCENRLERRHNSGDFDIASEKAGDWYEAMPFSKRAYLLEKHWPELRQHADFTDALTALYLKEASDE